MLEVRVLGSLEVGVGGARLDLRGSRRRALLAYLALHAGRVSSIERICEDVWAGRPPTGAAGTVKTYISQFRKLLGLHGLVDVVETGPGGYVIVPDRLLLDSAEFERLALEAEPLGADDRAAALGAALGLWRGEALADLIDAGWANRESSRLSALRSAARRKRAEALLSAGHADHAARELEGLLADEPFDEHVACVLARSHYTAGRPAEGLRVLSDLRHRLGEELGVDASPRVSELEGDILRHLLRPGATSSVVRAPELTAGAGVFTFLFVDIEGSTRLLQTLGEHAYSEALSTYRHLLADACALHQGTVFGSEGDGVFVAFARATDAVAAAGRAQRSLAEHKWLSGVSVRARMGVHTGEARLVDGDYVGLSVHVAARVCAAANGGQVFITGATSALVEGVPARPLGEHHLREVERRLALYQLLIPGTRDDPRPPRTVSVRPNNLPVPSDEFVGREAELRAVCEAVAGRRLVTLIGAGGAGKTRLALKAAAAMLPRFSDGVWLVELGAETDEARVAAATAGVVGVEEPPDVPIERSLLEWMRPRDMLLLLDNCEHVTGGASRLARAVTRSCPHVHVMATSREPLRLRGEQVLRVPPLSFGRDAEGLFTVRARAAAPGVDLDDGELVSRVCRRLDGLPLAIELAAARLRSLSLADLSTRLDDRFRLLATGSRFDEPRHHTLEAVVAWSYDLLDPNDRVLFDRCAIFVDDFALEAAEFVAFGPPLATDDVLDGLSRLVDKSLLTPVTDRARRTRYRMLETIRQYGHRRLTQSDSLAAVETRLVAWAIGRVAHLERCMRTPDQDAALRDADPDRANLRRAMELALSRGNDLAALRIISAAPVGQIGERRSLITRLVRNAVDYPEVVAQAYLTSCNLAFEQGDWEAALEDSREAARRFTAGGQPRLAAWARYIEALSRWGAGDLEDVDTILAEVLAAFRRHRDDFGLAYALWATSQREVDLVVADRMAAEGEGLLRAFGASTALAHDLEGRGLIALQLGEHARAGGMLTEALRRFAESGNMGCTAHCLEAVGALLVARERDIGAIAEVAGAAEALRNATGQQHRPWELRGQGAMRPVLEASAAEPHVQRAFDRGRRHDLTDAVDRALMLLDELPA